MAPVPLLSKRVVKKKITKFVRFESEDFGKMKSSWRKNRGIDNRVRRRFRGQRKVPKCGFGTDKVTKFYSRSGFKTFLVRCPADLEILLLNNRTYAGELAHNLSSRKRVALLKRAAELNVKITNSRGRVKTEEKKTE